MTLLLALPETTILRLMSLRTAPCEDLAAVIERLAAEAPTQTATSATARAPLARTHDGGPTVPSTDKRVDTVEERPAHTRRHSSGNGYDLQILGERFHTSTLVEALAKTLNLLADLDPTLLERWEQLHGRSRRHVARTADAIHPQRPDLNELHTLEFRPGWWIGTNYSNPDIRRIMSDVCRTAGLSDDEIKLVEV